MASLASRQVDRLNSFSAEALREALTRCCGSRRWVEGMLARHPFQSVEDLLDAADTLWWQLSPEDWLEAFSHHPKIGDINSLREKFADTKAWAASEQAGVNEASEGVLDALAKGNAAYEEKFGYIFIVCATGKTAGEMLVLLQARLGNSPEDELKIAAGQQLQITRLRLEKL